MKIKYNPYCILLAVLLALTAIPRGVYASEYRSISVIAVAGDATVARPGLPRELPAYEGMKLQDQDVLTVLSASTLILKLDDDKYVYLEPDTQIGIAASGGAGSTRTTIQLLKGAMSSEIQKKLGADETFSVSVGNVSMVVRGTVFRIVLGSDAEGNATVTVQTVEGEVAIDTGGESESALAGSYQAVVLLTESGGTLESIDVPIDYSQLPPQTRDWIHDAIEDKLEAATDPSEVGALNAILDALEAGSPDNTSLRPTKKPASTPKPTPTPTPVPTYSLTLQSAQGGTVTFAEGWYASGEQIPVSAAPDEGYGFIGWTVGGSAAPELGIEAAITFTMPASDTAIGATFELVPYYLLTIVQPAQGGGTIQGAAGQYPAGEMIPISAAPDDEYGFSFWLINGEMAQELGTQDSFTFTMPASDATISAVFSSAPSLGAGVGDASETYAMTLDSVAAFAPASDSEADLGGTSDDPLYLDTSQPPEAGGGVPNDNIVGSEASE